MGNVRADRVVLTSPHAQSTSESTASVDAANIIRDTPGIRKNAKGQPIALFEALVTIEARKKAGNSRVDFPLFGISDSLADIMPELHLTDGRMFQPGLRELIASDICAAQYPGFAIGDQRLIRGSEWRVVGHFVRGRTARSCTVYADANSVMGAFGRDTYNQVTIMLESVSGFEAFQAALKANPTLRIEARHESEVVAATYRQFNGILNFSSYFIGVIMAIGATLGAVNSLYAIVDSRRRELGTLRAIGFGSGPILVSILCESVLLALPGALLGSGLAWIFFNGLSASPLGFSFHLAVTPSIVTLGVEWSLAMGMLGGLFPALRAARLPVTEALRAN